MTTRTTQTTAPRSGRAALADPDVQRAIGRSAVYETLALAFASPTAESIERASTLIEDLRDHAVAREYGLVPRLDGLRDALAGADLYALQLEHNRLFHGDLLASPHETSYDTDGFSKAARLADVSGFYRAWGMQVASTRRTLPDYIGTELEFLALMTRKDAYAALRGWRHRRRLAQDAERSFMQSHLGRWVNAFAAEVRDAASDSGAGRFYAAAARACEQFVVMDVAVNGVLPPIVRERVVSPEDVDPASCGLEVPGESVEVLEPLDDPAGR